MMGAVSVVVVRYRLLLAPALAFLGFVAYRIHSVAKATGGTNGTSSYDMLSPFLIANGLLLMHQSAYNRESPSFWTYWLGESLVIGMFVVNSMNWTSMFGQPLLMYAAIATFSILTALWFRGKFWNYFLVIALELFLAIFIALAFPVMEMVLEAILNDKLKKVGDKLRHHHLRMEEYYTSKR
jgi:hypothetical protein